VRSSWNTEAKRFAGALVQFESLERMINPFDERRINIEVAERGL
jgi:hypothetical protein